jgi:hypothetical protein
VADVNAGRLLELKGRPADLRVLDLPPSGCV